MNNQCSFRCTFMLMPLSIHVAMAWLPSRRPFRRAFTRGPRLVRREHYEPPISSYGLRTSRRQPARKTVSAVPFAWTLRWPHVHLYRRVDYVAGLRRCPANPAACFAGAGANRHYSCTAFDPTRADSRISQIRPCREMGATGTGP